MNKVNFSKVVLLFITIMISQILCAKIPHNDGETPANKEYLIGEIAIYFPINQSRLIKDYSENAKSLMILDQMMNDKNFYSDIDSIIIDGYSSPEGSILHNSRLAYERAIAIKEYITQNFPHINSNKVIANGRLVNMQIISDIINNDLSVPFRREAKEVIDMQEISEVERLERLQKVGNGVTVQHIAKHYATSLRSATGIMFYKASDNVETVTEQVVIRDTVLIEGKVRIDTLIVKHPSDTIFINNYESIKKPLFALKTNLLYDLVTAVNIELEIPIGKRWSVLGEYIFPWWLMENEYCMQIISANLEGRYWFGNRNDRPQLTGWFAGLYAGSGYFDIEWENKGYQGEAFISTGLTGGFAHKLGKSDNLRMEYSLGAGYFKTQYHKYNSVFGSDDHWHLIRQRSGNYSWIGPTKLKVSLVWLLHHNSYKKTHQNK